MYFASAPRSYMYPAYVVRTRLGAACIEGAKATFYLQHPARSISIICSVTSIRCLWMDIWNFYAIRAAEQTPMMFGP